MQRVSDTEFGRLCDCSATSLARVGLCHLLLLQMEAGTGGTGDHPELFSRLKIAGLGGFPLWQGRVIASLEHGMPTVERRRVPLLGKLRTTTSAQGESLLSSDAGPPRSAALVVGLPRHPLRLELLRCRRLRVKKRRSCRKGLALGILSLGAWSAAACTRESGRKHD